MAFNRLTFGRDWTKETDFPTYQDSEEQVRADLQYHPNALQDFINNTLLAALEGKTAAGNLGALNGGAAATIQSVLDSYADDIAQLVEDIKTLASGGVPAIVRSTSVVFESASWVQTSSGVSLTIAKAEHKRDGDTFGYNLYQKVDGVYRSGTWGAAATRVVYNTNGSITLTADEAYSGKIVFFGM